MTTSTQQHGAAAAWRTVNIEVLKRAEEIPSLSTVVSEFLELAGRDFISAKDFEEVISKDQALVARLLKLANSGLYGKPRGVRSVPQAVVLIGLENMKKMVLAVSMEGLTRRRLNNYAYEPSRGYWMHSTAVGLAARAVIEFLPNKPMHGHEAFVAGLLHDVGKLVIDNFLDPADGKRQVSLEEEKEAAGLDHAELAEYILGKWQLPDCIVAAICSHHAVRGTADLDAGSLVLQLAHELVRTWQVGYAEPIDLGLDFDPDPHQDLLVRTGLPQSKIPQLVWDIRQNLSGIEKLYPRD